MHKIKLLSWRTRAKVEADDLMIENSMVGHNQEIDLNSRKLRMFSLWEKGSLKKRLLALEEGKK